MKLLTLQPVNETLEVRTETRVLNALLARRCQILMACGGNGLCATCHVHVRAGMEQLSPRTERERRTLSFISGTGPSSRLACQTHVRGDGVVLELPRGMFIERAEDLLSLLGTRAPADVLHPLRGTVLIGKGKIITRSQIEELNSLHMEVSQVRPDGADSASAAPPPSERKVAIPFLDSQSVRRPSALEAVAAARMASAANPPAPAAAVPDSVQLLHVPPRPTPSSASPGSTRFEIGCMVGKCLLLEKIGAGGNGIVYRALHKSLNIPAAVKVLHFAEDDDRGEVTAKFCGEARLLAQLNHPHVVRVWDFEEGPPPYLVLEYVEGLSLAELIEQSGRLCLDRALSVVMQVVEGLAAAWKLGIVHRDVKPANILLARDGTAKLADLGLAIIVDRNRRERQGEGAASAELMEGTVAYMAPEQAVASTSVDFRADIYSLGATLYHAITGRLPFRGRSRAEVVLKHVKEAPLPPHELVPDLHVGASTLILRMMAKQPVERHEDYRALQADLAELLDKVQASGAPRTQCPTGAAQSTQSNGRGQSIWKALLSSWGRKKADETEKKG